MIVPREGLPDLLGRNVVWHGFVSSLHERAARAVWGSIQTPVQEPSCVFDRSSCIVKQQFEQSPYGPLLTAQGIILSGVSSRSTSPKCCSELSSHRLTRFLGPGKKKAVTSSLVLPKLVTYYILVIDVSYTCGIPALTVTSLPNLGRSTTLSRSRETTCCSPPYFTFYLANK